MMDKASQCFTFSNSWGVAVNYFEFLKFPSFEDGAEGLESLGWERVLKESRCTISRKS